MSQRFEGTSDYVATDDLKVAVNAAVALDRPLLIKGEPGTGKTVLAYEVAWTLHMTHGFQREALFRAHVVKGGAPRDVIGLGLLAEDWVERRPAARTRLLEKGFSVEALDAPLV